MKIKELKKKINNIKEYDCPQRPYRHKYFVNTRQIMDKFGSEIHGHEDYNIDCINIIPELFKYIEFLEDGEV